MGNRAQYVVVEKGSWQRHYSHWAAGRVVDDLLPGPAAATRCFRANREIDEWLDDVWCEGAALVDHDRRTLLWFASADSWADHMAARVVLARTWPGWDVRFAHDGMGDLTHHLGLGRQLIREPGWFETFEPSWFADTENTRPRSVVSLRLPDGSVRAWGSSREPIEHIADGSGLIDLLVASPATPAPTDMPHGGVQCDPQARTVSLWAVQTVAGIHDRAAPRGLPLSPAPARVRPAQPRRGPQHPADRQQRDPRPCHGRARSRRRRPVVNPAALVEHEPTDPTPAELAALRTALDALLAGEEHD